MGTGFAMAIGEAATYLRGAESVADDLELGARLALDGVRVAHAPDARTLDEKPVRIGTAAAQRKRWMQGRFAVAEKYVPALLSRAAARGLTLPERARTLDVAFQLVAPSLLFTGVGLAGLGTAGALLRLVAPRTALGMVGAWPLFALGAAALFYVAPIPGIARFRPPAVVWLAYAVQPLYLALSVPLALRGWLGRRGRTWDRTTKGT
jgi:cellulose synthase/poly-beta-1,6-N-acetylglucosamine synthase-like glycosyltransferase